MGKQLSYLALVATEYYEALEQREVLALNEIDYCVEKTTLLC